MWSATRVAQRLGIEHAIIQGPFGNGASSPRLVAAVSNAGGLGSYGAVHLTPAQIRQEIEAIRQLTRRTFAINLWIPLPGERELRVERAQFDAAMSLLQPYYEQFGLTPPEYRERFATPLYEEQIEAVLDSRPPAFSFVYGVPSPQILERCRSLNIRTLGTATNVDEAGALDAAGVDIIVASGAEAGGHRISFLREPDESPGVLALIPQVVDAVKTPVVAAGGIADGRGIAGALALGAEGVQVGSAFLACDESNANPVHRAELRKPTARYTSLTRAFSGRYARGIKNELMRQLQPHESAALPFPVHSLLTQPIFQAAIRAGRPDSLSLWCGQSAALIRHTAAADLLRFLVADTSEVLGRLRQLAAQ
jgi:nitronate monooxygenase